MYCSECYCLLSIFNVEYDEGGYNEQREKKHTIFHQFYDISQRADISKKVHEDKYDYQLTEIIGPLVFNISSGIAMAKNNRPIFYLDFRSYASANPRRYGYSLL